MYVQRMYKSGVQVGVLGMNEDIAGVTTRFFNSIFGGVALKALVPIVVGGFVEYCRQAYAPAPTPA